MKAHLKRNDPHLMELSGVPRIMKVLEGRRRESMLINQLERCKAALAASIPLRSLTGIQFSEGILTA